MASSVATSIPVQRHLRIVGSGHRLDRPVSTADNSDENRAANLPKRD